MRILGGIIRAVFSFVSGEWILTSFGRRANGGGPVLLRSLWVTALLFSGAIGLHEWGACAPRCAPAWDKVPSLVSDKLPWLAAIFAAVYTSLYARFASQWLYLAGVYNQIMSAKVGMRASDPGPDPAAITRWQAGFIEDADDLHLASKSMFAAAVYAMLQVKEIRLRFQLDVHHGGERARRLETSCRKVLGPEVREIAECWPTLEWRHNSDRFLGYVTDGAHQVWRVSRNEAPAIATDIVWSPDSSLRSVMDELTRAARAAAVKPAPA